MNFIHILLDVIETIAIVINNNKNNKKIFSDIFINIYTLYIWSYPLNVILYIYSFKYINSYIFI